MRDSFFPSPQVLVVEASAGSGKTYALARRYVQLALFLSAAQTVPIQSILAITFTNKATLAMKSRILDFLKRIALKKLNPSEFDDIVKPLGLDDKKASVLAFRLMSDVIRQYHYFQVQTIDSFVNVLLVGCSFKVGLSARFKIRRNSKEYLSFSLDELLDQAHTNKEVYRLFDNFVRQYLFLENRCGWFPKDDLLKVISELFRQYNTFQKKLIVFPEHESPFIQKRRIFGLMGKLRDLCPPKTKKVFLEHLDSLLADEKGIFDLDQLNSSWSREDFPVNKGGEVPVELEALWKKIYHEIRSLCFAESHSIFNPYILLFEQVLEHFGQLSRRDDVLFLEELNRKAALLFEDGLVTVEELYFRLAARFGHYLIDEFQDTSLSQWRNLAMMVEEALSHGGSLFYVGDKKQAIYAFRGGESLLFDALQRQLKDFNVQTEHLDKNYRSSFEIIKFNNRVFSPDNLRDFLDRRLEDSTANGRRKEIHFSEVDFKAIKNTFAHSRQSPGSDLAGGLVRVSYLEGRVKEERALQVREELICLIKQLRQRFSLRDMAVLTRGNDDVEEITRWLLEEGVYASSERSSDIKNNPLINELISLFQFLYSPLNDNAFAQFCLGELMPKAAGMDSQALRDFLFDAARLRRLQEAGFYQSFRASYPQVCGRFFDDFLSQAGVYPLYELTTAIIQRFGCEKHFPHYQGFLMHFLELIKMQEKESCDMSSFLDYFENLEGEDRYVPMDQVDALKVMTVHKAKGLEFPVVIVPYLEMDVKASSGGRDGSQAYILDIQQEGMGLIRLKEAYREFCPQLQALYEQEYRKSFLVELNNAYVALTRAIEELYVFVPLKVGNTVNPAMFLIPDECVSLGTPKARPGAHEQTGARVKIKPFISDSWTGLREEFLNQPAQSAQQARQGQSYHALLMHVGIVNEQNIDETIGIALRKASSLFPHLSGQGAAGGMPIISEIRDFITRPDIRPFFFLPTGTRVLCEKEFVNARGETRRIDRLIIFEDKVWIVDFKLSKGAQGEHQQQMDGYINMLCPFYPEHKVSGHILYFMRE